MFKVQQVNTYKNGLTVVRIQRDPNSGVEHFRLWMQDGNVVIGKFVDANTVFTQDEGGKSIYRLSGFCRRYARVAPKPVHVVRCIENWSSQATVQNVQCKNRDPMPQTILDALDLLLEFHL